MIFEEKILMKRRDALKSLAVSGVAAMLPLPLSAVRSPPAKPLHVLALGGAGRNIAKVFQEKGVKAKYTALNQAENLPYRPEGFDGVVIVRPEYNWNDKLAGIGKCKSYKEYQQHSILSKKIPVPSSVYKGFHPGEHYILLAGLGGYTGTHLTVELSRYFSRQNISFTAFAVMPFTFEGKRRRWDAMYGLQHVKPFTDINMIHAEDIRRKYGNLSLTKAFNVLDEEVYKLFHNRINFKNGIYI